ncbi:major facilitator superfamily domain-containing protein [Zychaea mexicana]|uniref:major facilitator superfamily domain-containing protein n=1 Tax=Zychaea mexicana TaxID=64656 RepID=UPI0022FF12DE|nr:major facilitator superfamily domain-containing protein [Zychaea mexicana]KAI9484515.1 major facilitator superfamily domain-containing protein [Zychaea mexicana]
MLLPNHHNHSSHDPEKSKDNDNKDRVILRHDSFALSSGHRDSSIVFQEDYGIAPSFSSSEDNNNGLSSLPEKKKEKGSTAASSSDGKVIYRINFRILPFLAVIMFLQQIDKQVLNYTGPLGMYGNTDVTLDQFRWLGPSLHLGTMAMLIPAGFYLVHKFRPAKVMSMTMVLWGIVLTCMMACTNFQGLLACRILLGMCEAAVLPAAFILIKSIYRRSEQLLYIGFCYTAMTAAVSFGSLLTFGFSHVGDAHGISAWKWVTLIWGTITIAASIASCIYLPDDPYSKRFGLSAEQEDIVDARVSENAMVRDTQIHWSHIQEALSEPRYYCQAVIAFLVSMPMGCIGDFSAQIIQEMGFNGPKSVALNLPRGIYDILTYVFYARQVLKSRLRNHIAYTVTGFSFIPLIGMIILAVCSSLNATTGKMVGLVFSPTNFATAGTQALISSNVSGYTKAIFYIVTNVFAINLGHFIGPILLRRYGKDDPYGDGDPTAAIPIMIMFIFAELVSICLLYYIGRSLYRDRDNRLAAQDEVALDSGWNNDSTESIVKKKRASFVTTGNSTTDGHGFINLTDVHDIQFMYRP